MVLILFLRGVYRLYNLMDSRYTNTVTLVSNIQIINNFKLYYQIILREPLG